MVCLLFDMNIICCCLVVYFLFPFLSLSVAVSVSVCVRVSVCRFMLCCVASLLILPAPLFGFFATISFIQWRGGLIHDANFVCQKQT